MRNESTTDSQCVTKRVCVICRLHTKHMRTVPKDARLYIFILQGIMVPCDVKCWRSHFTGQYPQVSPAH